MWVPMFSRMGDFGQICLAYSWMCFNSYYEIKEETIKVMMPSVGHYRREAKKKDYEEESDGLVAEVCKESSIQNINALRASAYKLGIDIPDLGKYSCYSNKNHGLKDVEFEDYIEHKKETSKGTKELIIMQKDIEKYKSSKVREDANYQAPFIIGMYFKSLNCSPQGFLLYMNSMSQCFWHEQIDEYLTFRSDGDIKCMGHLIYHDDHFSSYLFRRKACKNIMDVIFHFHIFSGGNPSKPKTNLTSMPELTSEFGSQT